MLGTTKVWSWRKKEKIKQDTEWEIRNDTGEKRDMRRQDFVMKFHIKML